MFSAAAYTTFSELAIKGSEWLFYGQLNCRYSFLVAICRNSQFHWINGAEKNFISSWKCFLTTLEIVCEFITHSTSLCRILQDFLRAGTIKKSFLSFRRQPAACFKISFEKEILWVSKIVSKHTVSSDGEFCLHEAVHMFSVKISDLFRLRLGIAEFGE